MKRDLRALAEIEHDLLIIGGGITGACLAFDAATRGLRVALIEKDDFGGATSAASSKLLHGGLRYLQQLRFGKVRESARERLFFQNLAPHLVEYVPFVVPTYRGLAKSKPVLSAGMLMYETLCIGNTNLLLDKSRAVPAGRGMGVEQVLETVSGVNTDGLTGGRLFYESHMQNSERMTLAFIDGAVAHGATVANYTEAIDFIRQDQRVCGVVARGESGESQEIRARAVINASGPWIRELNASLDLDSSSGVVTGFSRGAHIVTRPLTDGHAVALPTQRPSESVIDRGGRHVFIIPWRGHSLIGTSYAPHEGPLDDMQPTSAEIGDLIEDINGALGPGTLTPDDVRYAFAGLYPLTADEIDPGVYQGSADYQVVDHRTSDGVPGLFTVFGAKFTTARLLAERALDAIVPSLSGEWSSCQTRETALPAGEAVPAPGSLQSLPGSMGHDLVAAHGAYAGRVADLAATDSRLQQEIGDGRGVWAASVVWAVREEMAQHLADVVFRRTGLGTVGDPGTDVLRLAAVLMAKELDWDADRTAREIAAVQERFQW
ncbi:MAG: FAD-dependent oxidoreductase [Acidobacteria bacterium]|nr:FAD-dependent oxidoreductase [Acidobacteriota bacterium]